MPSYLLVRAASFERARTTPYIHRLIAIAFALLLSGCATRPAAPYIGADPADPSSPARAIEHRSTIGRFAGLRPAEPALWSTTSAPPSRSPR